MQFNKKKLPFQPVTLTEFERFTEALQILFEKNETGSSEENYKINFVEFLHSIFQKKNHINALPLDGNMGIDLAIHLNKSGKSKAGVHFEIKKPSNVSEMISSENLNRKAFHESVLYFLFDKITNKNDESKHIIISNLDEFFIFDAQEFTRLFFRENKAYSNEFEAWKAGQRNDTTTKHIYDFIAQKMSQSDKQISGYHIRLNDYRTHLRTLRDQPDDLKARNQLAQLCHIFSPQFLLKQIDTNDSNTLNKDFYHELLHIIGLKEVKIKGKKLIQRKPEAEREYASMLENTISEIKAEGISSNEDQQFEIALELCLTWVNRILFLKLLESQLYQYHNENEDYKFLTNNKIQGYDQLKTLFFQVLAVQPHEREAHIKDRYDKIPYLNSSLFESTPLERDTVRISSLRDDYRLSIHPKTKLQDTFADGKCPTLEYLLRFLDAYDFGAVGKQELIRDEQKPLINAAVLGLIFEKINGYKEGSFYTPGFVTMYMCRETIRRAALQKINNQLGWNCQDLREVRDKIDSRDGRKAVSETLNRLTICDPAVGSGHFLVSALNEIIALKAELGVILNSNYDRIKCSIEIDNDELQVKDEDDLPFTYHLNSKGNIIQEKQAIQEAIFREKRTIIESCLFGVDINPNSVKICRLRLWIELLKNAFYTAESNYRNLETLPNIDINIKQGNSLISRFPLDQDLQSVFKKKDYKVKTYKANVAEYRRTRNRDKKNELIEYLEDIKSQFKTIISGKDKLEISRLRGEIQLIINPTDLFEKVKIDKKKLTEKKAKLAKLEAERAAKEANTIYDNAFEWRFEFPEVLDADGAYVGFDCVIGNPPYVQLQSIKEMSKAYRSLKYVTYESTGDLYALFYERGTDILRNEGLLTFITGSAWMRANYGKSLRKFFIDKIFIKILIDLSDSDIFDSATVLTSIIIFQKATQNDAIKAIRFTKKDQDRLSDLENIFNNEHTKIDEFSEHSWIISDQKTFDLKQKVEQQGIKLKDWNIEINRGVLTGFNEAFIINKTKKDELIGLDSKNAEIIKPILRGRDIQKYQADFQDLYLIHTHNGIRNKDKKTKANRPHLINPINVDDYPTIKSHLNQYYAKLKKRTDKGITPYNLRNCAYFETFEKPKIVYPNMTKFMPFMFDSQGFFTNQKCYIITGDSTEYLTSFFNSKLFKFCFEDNFPELQGNTRELNKVIFEQISVKQINKREEDSFKEKVAEIHGLKQDNPQADTTALEAEIDCMVYDLYGLTKKEIKIIESAVK